MSDPYSILGVAQDADYDTIKKAHHGLCMEFYSNARNPALRVVAHDKFKRVQEAWKVVSNTYTRAELDQSLRPPEKMDAASKTEHPYNLRSVAKATLSFNAGLAPNVQTAQTIGPAPSAAQKAPENWEIAKKAREEACTKLHTGIKQYEEATDLIPTDYPGHPDIHRSKPSAERAKAVSQAYSKASKLATAAYTDIRLAKSGLGGALELLEQAKDGMLSGLISASHLNECKEMIIHLRIHDTEATEYMAMSNADSRKFHVLAMAWLAEADVLENGGRDDGEDEL
ncbi:hypothetical protein BU16DRAFT_563873 [Lophium mytilinum]|uniref:J domain-containing protein n=1 Tax=Lophium mytilinum TaxID=390894 RepID=A0A6A6QKQ9_9PEZI|nr:hypothetical protein BU16DRAFT_563873 [Lophium mytilinum]